MAYYTLCILRYLNLGFWIRFLIIGVFCFTGFYASAQNKEENNYLSIPDFTIHRVNLEKATTSPEEKPKLRTIIEPEKKLATKLPSVNTVQENKQSKTPQTNQDEAQSLKKDSTPKTVSESVKPNNTETQEKIKAENNLNKIPQNKSSDETISKINQINEDSQLSSKETFDKNIIVKDNENSFLKTFSSLSIVLLLIFIFAWVYARVKGINPTAILTGNFSEKNLNKFNVLSTSTLGQGKDIHLVEINGKQLVIGSTNNNINLLTEIPPEEIEKLKGKSPKLHDNELDEPLDFSEEDEFCYEAIEDEEFMDPDCYSLKYSEVYKDYINKAKNKNNPE